MAWISYHSKIMNEDPFKYSVRLLGSPDLKKFKDDVWSLCEPSEWCVENVGLHGYAWKRLAYWGNYGNKGAVFYYFRNQDHATLFKLTFGDY